MSSRDLKFEYTLLPPAAFIGYTGYWAWIIVDTRISESEADIWKRSGWGISIDVSQILRDSSVFCDTLDFIGISPSLRYGLYGWIEKNGIIRVTVNASVDPSKVRQTMAVVVGVSLTVVALRKVLFRVPGSFRGRPIARRNSL